MVSEPHPSGEWEVRRVAQGGDGVAVEALARVCFPDEAFSVDEELGRPWARLWTAHAPPAPRAESPDDADPKGFLVAWHIADELHVLNVATAPPVRRRGVARALLDEALAYARRERARILLLEVRRSNHPAIQLYRRLGFTTLGVRRGYYADNGEDAVEMILALDPDTGQVVPTRDEIRIDG